MKQRTKLSDRVLPNYSFGEETMNMVTHIVGGAMAIGIFLFCLFRASGAMALTGCIIYGISMIGLYTVSSVYHGLHPGTAKKVMQILDHCTIYYLIVGSYTAVLLGAIIPRYPGIGWGLLGVQWGLAILATVLTAIDLKKYKVFSMFCYIAMGWGIALFLPQALDALTPGGFGWLLSGGIAYTVGAVLYAIKRPWMHAVFHIFVVLGSLLQFIAIAFYAI